MVESRLRVAVRRRRIAVHGAEVPLAIDERIAERELLNHPHQRVVHRAVAVGVVFTQDIAHDRRRLLVAAARDEAQLVHCVEDPAVDRLETVADIRQRAGDNDAHRVIDERLLHLLLDEAGKDALARVGSAHSRVHQSGFGRPANAAGQRATKYTP